MEELKDRLIKVRHDLNMSQTKFANFVGLSRNTICKLEHGSIPAPETIAQICRKLSIDSHWLLTGDGEPYVSQTEEEQLQSFIDDLKSEINPSFRRRFVAALSKLGREDWDCIEQLLDKLCQTKDN